MTNQMKVRRTAAPIADGQPARQKGRERRRQIVEAARGRLLSTGVEGLVLRDLAEQLGITHGNLQYYFATKAALIGAVFDEEIAKYTDTMRAAAASTSTRQGRLAALLDSSLLLLSSEDVRLWHILFGIAHQNPELTAILKRENERYESAVVEELAHISPEMSTERRIHVAKMIRMLVDGLGITIIYEPADGPAMAAMKSEVKALLNNLLALE